MSTPAQYARQLKALLPRGIAWNLERDSYLSRVMLALAEELARVHTRTVDLVRELDPRTTLELLADWERMLGLPDVCAPAEQTVQERRDAAVAKYTRLGGQSPQFFIDLAAAIGYEVTITEFYPFRADESHAGDALTNDAEWAHTWRVNGRETTFRRFTAGLSAAGEAVRDWGNEELECVISLRRPAHTVLLFGYPPPMEIDLVAAGEPAGALTVEKPLAAAVNSGGAPAGDLTVETP
jgi:uncharacterized protein YmfQ (DUF2313 family)